jgi:hypothetical protein
VAVAAGAAVAMATAAAPVKFFVFFVLTYFHKPKPWLKSEYSLISGQTP